jgi:hypothetical protein
MTDARIYTRAEADAMLPDLIARIERIRAARRILIDSAERIERRVREDGGGVADRFWFEASAALKTEVEAMAADDLVLRDPATGLIDFPAEIEGTPGFLCWKMGESEVAFWHPADTGFAGRRPL